MFAKKKIEYLKALNEAKGVLHLGGHKGAEAEVYNWFSKKVIWFEAVPYIYDLLKENTFVYPSQKCFCVLLGDEDYKKKEFYISNNDSASSSLFDFSKNTLSGKYFPERKLEMKKKILLMMNKLDTIIKNYEINIREYDHWVLDLQGSELLALKGAEDSIQYCNSMLIEVSKVDIYEGGVLWNELSEWLKKKDFYPLLVPEKNHSDVIFIRKKQ